MSSTPKRTESSFRRIAVIGLGAMGGSFARAATATTSAEVVGWSPDPDERLSAVDTESVAAAPERWSEAVAGADLVMLAIPLGPTCKMMAELASTLEPAAVVADVASLKGPVAEAVAEAGLTRRWVGCHPMAGVAESGFAASSPTLYDGATVWITNDPEAEDAADRMRTLWTRFGATPQQADPHEHDRMIALVSALPQLTANALATTLAEAGIDPEQLGSGGSDMTRLATSSPDIWIDILSALPEDLVVGLRLLGKTVNDMTDAVEAGDMQEVREAMMRSAKWKAGS